MDLTRLCLPVINLMAFTGESMEGDLFEAIKVLDLNILQGFYEKQRKRVEKIFDGEKPNRTPVSVDIRWWLAEQYHDGELENIIKKCDFDKIIGSSVFIFLGFPEKKYSQPEPIPGIKEEITWSGPPIKYKVGGYPGSIRKIKIITKHGTLTAAEAYATRSFGVVEYPVKNIEDLKIITFIFDQIGKYTDFKPTKNNYMNNFFSVAPFTPLQMFLVHLAGVEKGVYMLMDHKNELNSFMKHIEEIQLPAINILAKKSKVIFSVENFSADVSSGYFESYIGPQLERRTRITKKYGCVYGVHQDGKLFPLLTYLSAAGVGYVNGITASPSGDLEPESIRKSAGNNIIIQDILPQSIFMPEFDIKSFESYTKRVIEFYKNDAKVIFGIGDMLPLTGDLKRLEFVINLLIEN